MFNMFMNNDKVNENLKTKVEDFSQDYFYFLKLVPHEFIDYIDRTTRNTYSYSLNHNKKNTDNILFPSLTFILDYAPVKMILTKQERKTGRFLINMCSIVGGVFVIFGLFNAFLLRVCSK